MKSYILALFLMAQHKVVNGALDYDYADNGDNWATDANKACKNGKKQSPIDLPTDMDGKVEKSYFKHYENVVSAGNTAAVTATHYG
jgi:carbonic anhydrase